MSEITWIIPEKDSASDEGFEILSLPISNGEKVTRGQIIAECEGAKSIFEIESPTTGFFYSTVALNEIINIGEPLGFISTHALGETPFPVFDSPTNSKKVKPGNIGDPKATESAKELAKKLNFDLHALSHLKLITTQEINDYLLPSSKEETNSELTPVERILLIGAGNGAILAKECLKNYQSIIGVLDDNQNKLEKYGIKSLGGIRLNHVRDLFEAGQIDSAFISVTSDIKLRERYYSYLLENSIRLSTLIHRNSFVAKSAEIGQGSLILDTARVGYESSIGELCFISASVNIEHHCKVGNNVTFGPGVFLSGDVSIGNNCNFGAGIFVEPGVRIGENCTIASMNLITKSVPENSIVKNVATSKVVKK